MWCWKRNFSFSFENLNVFLLIVGRETQTDRTPIALLQLGIQFSYSEGLLNFDELQPTDHSNNICI